MRIERERWRSERDKWFKATNEVGAYHDAGFIAGGLKALAREFLLAFGSGDAAAVSDIAELAEFYGVLDES